MEPSPRTIYVSLHDPVGEPSFRPSPAKPIPKWMQLLHHGPQQSEGRNVQDYQVPSQSYTHPRAQPQEQIRTSFTSHHCPVPGRTSSRGSLSTPDQRRAVKHARSMPALPETMDAELESDDLTPIVMVHEARAFAPPVIITDFTPPDRVLPPLHDRNPYIAPPANICPCQDCNTGGKGKAPERALPQPPTHRGIKRVS